MVKESQQAESMILTDQRRLQDALKGSGSILDVVKSDFLSSDISPWTVKSRQWFLKYVTPLKIKSRGVTGDRTRKAEYSGIESVMGKMLLYVYQPKTKEELNYYDVLPLTIPFSPHNDGWTGINIHYLPPYIRGIMMTRLQVLATDRSYDKKTRLNIIWDVIKRASVLKEVKVTVKRYLFDRIVSNIIEIPPSEWEYATYLSLERFNKKSKDFAWQDSLQKVK